jgi:hypothetical protein
LRKQGKNKTAEVEVQCDSLSAEQFDQIVELCRKERKCNHDLRLQVGQLHESLEIIQKETATAQGCSVAGEDDTETDDELSENSEVSLVCETWQVPAEIKEAPFDGQSKNIIDRIWQKAATLFTPRVN